MPAFASITSVNDGETSPVAHTFVPRDITNGVATFIEAGSTGVPLEDKLLTVSKVITKDNGRFKTTFKLIWPIVATETINGVSQPIVLRKGYFDGTFTFDPSSTAQERDNVLSVIGSLFGKTIPHGVVESNEGIY